MDVTDDLEGIDDGKGWLAEKRESSHRQDIVSHYTDNIQAG